MLGFMKRHASAYRLVKQITASDEFGAITSVHITYAHWSVGGIRPHLMDMSIHALDTVRWLLGNPLRVTSYKRPVRDNHALALMFEHRSGAISQLNLSAFQPGVQEQLVVTGEDAIVRVDNLTQLAYVRQAPNTSIYDANTLPDRENDVLILQGYATEMIAFADAIRRGERVSASIDDGVAAMRLIEAIADAPIGMATVELNEGDTAEP